MNNEEIMNLVRQLLTLAGGVLAARGIASQGEVSQAVTDIYTAVPALVSLGSIVWSVYVHWNMKKVPENSVAIHSAAVVGAPVIGTQVAIPSAFAKVVGALLIALASYCTVDPARAQFRLTGNPQKDFARAFEKKETSIDNTIATVLAKPFKDIADFIGEDADGAVALATAIPNLQDGHGQQCWIAMQSFGEIIKAHPIPITFHVINDYESLRLLGMATNNLCSNVHCTQVFADFTAMSQAASPVPLAIPSLHDLCTKVPQIAVVAPVTVAAPATSLPVVSPAK